MRFIQIFLIIILTQTFVYGQDSLLDNPFWLNWSIGGSPKYLNASLSYNKALENLSYQISINGTIEDILSTKGMTTGNVGIGLAHKKVWLISAVYLGPSVSYGEANDKSKQRVYFWGVGFSLNAQAYFMPLYKLFPDLGLGIELFYNMNVMQTKNVDYKNVYTIRIGACITNIHIY